MEHQHSGEGNGDIDMGDGNKANGDKANADKRDWDNQNKRGDQEAETATGATGNRYSSKRTAHAACLDEVGDGKHSCERAEGEVGNEGQYAVSIAVSTSDEL